MNDITERFGVLYRPIKTLVVYEENSPQGNTYVESYDMDGNGFPINAHPLSVRESSALAKALDTSEELQRNFLKPSGLLPKNVLYINPSHNGYAIWHTPAQRVELFFIDSLDIPCGIASIPPLMWRASKGGVCVYALKNDTDINEQTPLFHAPFFNIAKDGKVCMGTVKVNITADCLLEDFIQLWQQYFFNTYFSHLIMSKSPVNGNIVQLWQKLIGTKKQFPINSLLPNGYTLKNLLK